MAGRQETEREFRKAKEQAEKLEEISAILTSLSGNKLEAALQSLSNCWCGDGASFYNQKGVKLQEKISDTAKGLRKTAQEIRMTAQRIRDSEPG